jgi:hypothetical protein
VLILLAVPFLIFDARTRPSFHSLTLILIVSAMAGVVLGVGLRYLVPLERRLMFIRSLNPWLARHIKALRESGPDDRLR